MHPLMIIFALLAGGQIGGVIGLILAVPMFAVGKVIIHHLRLHLKNRKPVT
jgi:predicted PurR-regulated permease PerM